MYAEQILEIYSKRSDTILRVRTHENLERELGENLSRPILRVALKKANLTYKKVLMAA